MNSEENKDLEIVMGDDSDLEISEVGDMINDLKPKTSKEKKSIIIPVSMNKAQNSNEKKESTDNEVNSKYDSKEAENTENKQDDNK